MQKELSQEELSRKDFLCKQPKKRFSAGTIFFNDKGEILILKTNYNVGWSLPGGMSDLYESPIENALRETREEIGLDTKITKLLCVDYLQNKRTEDEQVVFTFLGEDLTSKQIKNIKLQESEIVDYKFASKQEAIELLKESVSKRVEASLGVIDGDNVCYLEGGNKLV